jgi:hypothetical protein
MIRYSVLTLSNFSLHTYIELRIGVSFRYTPPPFTTAILKRLSTIHNIFD